MRFKIILPIFFCISRLLNGQQPSIQMEETGIWNGLYLKVRFSKYLGYYGEHHYRTRNREEDLWSFYGRPRQWYNRAGINILFNPYFEAVIGPTLVFNYAPRMDDTAFDKITLEPRIWHQWLFSMPAMGRVKIYHQFRFEHRWRRSNLKNSTYEYTDRYRYKFFAYIPINKKKIEKKTWFVSPSFEIFMQSGRSIINNPFEDFRTYNGIGYVYNNNLTFFVGHMYTLGQKSSGFEYKTSHILRFNVMIGLDVRSVEKRLPNINLGF
ncbi:MAG: DUF2490 domain-containing protein [Thermaurantimonas sp.]|uniref:DUF2490 domain-containing protein n=1 Tax=Thermaurantimonas sp. TaxID=2681568 RepID=UPI00391CBF1C